jgi:hypothetical protein
VEQGSIEMKVISVLRFLIGLVFLCFFATQHAFGEASRAEGFVKLPPGATIAVMPLDIELYSLSAGGIPEPQAEWTAKAHENLSRAFREKPFANIEFISVGDDNDAEIEPLNRLHGAVGSAIVLHHTLATYALPSKQGKLDWSLGDTCGKLKTKTGAQYALFSYVRDSYASGERVAAIVVGLIFGVGLQGGVQTGYASLVDIDTGQIVWFNRLARARGDLRDFKNAQESLNALLEGFPN